MCGTASNTFPLAEYQAAGQPQRPTRELAGERSARNSAPGVLLVCTHCDEAFTPQFYRICPACGHDAGDGIDPRRHATDPISGRVLLAIYALVAVIALLLLYFWFLFRGR